MYFVTAAWLIQSTSVTYTPRHPPPFYAIHFSKKLGHLSCTNSHISDLTDCILLVSSHMFLYPRVFCEQVIKPRVLFNSGSFWQGFFKDSALYIPIVSYQKNMCYVYSFSDGKLAAGSRHSWPDRSIMNASMNLSPNGFSSHWCPWPWCSDWIRIWKWWFSVILFDFISCDPSIKK